jgi:hypothetical protein
MQKLLFSFGIFLSMTISSTKAQSLNSRMATAIKKAIGSDIKSFKTYSYPTDNYGLITCYSKRINDKRFLCDTWNCIGFQSSPNDAKNWLDINGYAALGGGGPIELNEETKRSYALNIALPKIINVLNLGIGFNAQSTQNVQLTIGKAYKRNLRKDSLIKYFSDPDVTSSAKNEFNAGTLRLIVSDLVIENMAVEVTLDKTTTDSLEAKFGNNETSKVFSDASLSFKVEKVTKGTYKFSIDKPVIYAYLSKRQPSAGALGASVFFDDWLNDQVNFPSDPTQLKHQKIMLKRSTGK